MKRFLLLGVLFSFPCFSQNFGDDHSLLVPNDSIAQVDDTVKKHSVRTAVLLSAVVPGAGQVYNHIAMPKGKKKAYWKVPLIYAGLGATTYFLISNQREQLSLRNEYSQRLDLGVSYVNPAYMNYDTEGVLALYNLHLNWRDLSILGVGIVYLLQVVDAGVEAHFVSFDVSEDLSLKLSPKVFDRSTAGLSFTFNFR